MVRHRVYFEVALELKSAVELHGLSLDPARVLAEGKVRSLRSDTLIEPDAPCPCGSGKKYGNCCGRVV